MESPLFIILFFVPKLALLQDVSVELLQDTRSHLAVGATSSLMWITHGKLI